ncbi:hypothetical protein UFOVP978_8 [uncultured Caudovirales phage]|uniref:Terminase n=1 Tax=uncultured Caudovirales phage TaxID=2100421 RepID=A0A6J5PZW2_9CAUD|nr:hypothetical protein UFOVP978_8 [uncultured Caudovirales phage]
MGGKQQQNAEKLFKIDLDWIQDDDSLHLFVEHVWGVKIPRNSVCPNHVAPFTAFANAFFDRDAVQIWKASRGFGGKSWLLGTLTLTEAVIRGAMATILGGSASQSFNVHEVIQESLMQENGPKDVLAADPTRYQTTFLNGAWIRPLMASQRSVRGPHPQRLRLDEIDEMEYPLLTAALGQPMHKQRMGKLVKAQTIMSSTHQYPDGTMTQMLKEAAEKQWPVYEWCYRENLVSNGGWLDDDEVAAKKLLVPKAMWDAEYELQEPSFEGRAFDIDAIHLMFSRSPKCDGRAGQEFIFQKPEPGVQYVTGVDWAREKDWTVIWTFRTDTAPWETVAFQRTNKEYWQSMIAKLNDRLQRYPGMCAYDSTGIGNVVGDYIEEHHDVTVVPVILSPSSKATLFSDYIAAVEQNNISAPQIDFALTEHRYCRLLDLFGNSRDGHPPDSVVAGALAWSMRNKDLEVVAPDLGGLEKQSYWSDWAD